MCDVDDKNSVEDQETTLVVVKKSHGENKAP